MPRPKLIAVPAGSSELCSGCECPAPIIKEIRFQKQWYGYYGFNVTGVSIVEQIYRTMTVVRHPTDGMSSYTVTLSVTFNRLNGHPTVSLTTDYPGDVAGVWPDTAASKLADLIASTPGAVTETTAHFADADGPGLDEDWTLSDAYTLTMLQGDVNDLAALYTPGDVDTNAVGDNVQVRYNELDNYSCSEDFMPPPCRFPFFFPSGGEFRFLPYSKANYDLIGSALSPVVVIDDPALVSGMQASNAFNQTSVGIWFQGYWIKSKQRIEQIASHRCLTTDVSSSFETVADVCTFPAQAGDGVLFLNPPESRALDQFTTTGFSVITATLCMPCDLTAGDCPCVPL
jgi:hypothetical protein